MIAVLVIVVLAGCDGAFAGFRSSAGRTGLVRHRAEDVRAHLRGFLLVVALLVPAALVALLEPADGVRAARAMLLLYAPYGALVLLALAAYASLPWRLRFLAMALVLGPFTLARPLVAVAGGAFGLVAADATSTRVAVGLAVLAVLAVPRLADRLWYD